MKRNTTTSFAGRVEYAIRAIYHQEDSCARDDCYEMHDGDIVVTAIIRQADITPALQVAMMQQWSNFPSYADHPWHDTANKYVHVKDHDLPVVAAKIRKKARDDFAEWMARETGYRTELTSAGEQGVIPGCERDDRRTGATQLDLF